MIIQHIQCNSQVEFEESAVYSVCRPYPDPCKIKRSLQIDSRIEKHISKSIKKWNSEEATQKIIGKAQ